MEKGLKCLFLGLLSICLLLTFTACSGTSPTEQAQATVTRTIDYSQESIDRSTNSLKADFDQLREKVANTTDEGAKELKGELDQLRTNVESFDKELNKAVEDGKLTQEVKRSYDGFIETLKTDMNNLDKEIEEK